MVHRCITTQIGTTALYQLFHNSYYIGDDQLSFQLTTEQKRKLIKLLQEIVKYADLEALALVTRTGISIAFFSEKEADPDLLLALRFNTVS